MEKANIKETKTPAPKAAATKSAAKATKKLKITLVKSSIGAKPNQRATVEALGLKKPNSWKIQPDNEAIRGMIFTIKHMVKVEEL